MQNEPENKTPEQTDNEDKSPVSGFTQKVIGELETIGGVLTGDPLTRAEGEFNVDVGKRREEIEEELEQESKN
jgi:uncharacterized protein YjbJ (UPF0337 family)